MQTRRKYAIPLIAAGAVAAGIGSAPIAGANPDCEQRGLSVHCSTNGSTAITTQPDTQSTYDGIYSNPLYDPTP